MKSPPRSAGGKIFEKSNLKNKKSKAFYAYSKFEKYLEVVVWKKLIDYSYRIRRTMLFDLRQLETMVCTEKAVDDQNKNS